MTGSTPIVAAGFVLLLALAVVRARLDRREGARRVFATGGHVEVLFTFALLATLVVLGATQIVLRNAFQSGLLWADPVMRHIVLWLGAAGAGLAAARVRHISVDALSRLLPVRLRAARRLVVYGATAIAAYLLAVAAARLVVDEREFGEIAFLGIHTWVMQLILPASFALITYRSLLAIFLAREPEDTVVETTPC